MSVRSPESHGMTESFLSDNIKRHASNITISFNTGIPPVTYQKWGSENLSQKL